MTCCLKEKTHNPNIPRDWNLTWQTKKKVRGKKKRPKNKTSYVTLFLLKDKAAVFPFVRDVMQDCTTQYHPRPKCGRSIHRYINIKISPIQTYLPIESHIFILHSHDRMCFVKMSYLCLYMWVCVELCVNVFCQNHVHLHCRTTCLSNPTGWHYWGKIRGGGAQQNREQDGTEKFTITDGR